MSGKSKHPNEVVISNRIIGLDVSIRIDGGSISYYWMLEQQAITMTMTMTMKPTLVRPNTSVRRMTVTQSSVLSSVVSSSPARWTVA